MYLAISSRHQSYVTFVGSIADDGPRFAGTGLTVREEGAVEALPSVVKDALTNVLEHFFLERERCFGELNMDGLNHCFKVNFIWSQPVVNLIVSRSMIRIYN